MAEIDHSGGGPPQRLETHSESVTSFLCQKKIFQFSTIFSISLISLLHSYHRLSISLSSPQIRHARCPSSDATDLAARASPRRPCLAHPQCRAGAAASLLRPSVRGDGLGGEAREGPEEARGDHGDGLGLRLRQRRRRLLREAPRRRERDHSDRSLRRVQVPDEVRRPDPGVLLRGIHRRQERPSPRRLPPILHCRRKEGSGRRRSGRR